MWRPVLRSVIGAAVWLFAASAWAQWITGYPEQVFAYDSREIALLPPYCKYTQDYRDKVPGGNDGSQIERWKVVLGPTYEHMHHYCWGLMKTNRGVLLARTEQARSYYLSDAVTEFDYVIARSPRDFILLPEMLSRKGENLVRLGRGGAAVVSFELALQAKADYWPPYAHMSDYYKNLGEPDKAREILERGLVAVPDAIALKRRLEELSQSKAPSKAPRPTAKSG